MPYYRKPRVENRYNLTLQDIEKLKVVDSTLISILPFFIRDECVDPHFSRWYTTGIAGTESDRFHRTNNRFWIFIYDEGPVYPNQKFRFDIWICDDLYRYKFRKFFQKKDIKNENDMIIQEKFLGIVNQLIDTGILSK